MSMYDEEEFDAHARRFEHHEKVRDPKYVRRIHRDDHVRRRPRSTLQLSPRHRASSHKTTRSERALRSPRSHSHSHSSRSLGAGARSPRSPRRRSPRSGRRNYEEKSTLRLGASRANWQPSSSSSTHKRSHSHSRSLGKHTPETRELMLKFLESELVERTREERAGTLGGTHKRQRVTQKDVLAQEYVQENDSFVQFLVGYRGVPGRDTFVGLCVKSHTLTAASDYRQPDTPPIDGYPAPYTCRFTIGVDTTSDQLMKFMIYDERNCVCAKCNVSLSQFIDQQRKHIKYMLSTPRGDPIKGAYIILRKEVVQVSEKAPVAKWANDDTGLTMTIGCRNLPQVNGKHLLDPVVVCFVTNPVDDETHYIGQTELLKGTELRDGRLISFNRTVCVPPHMINPDALLLFSVYDVDQDGMRRSGNKADVINPKQLIGSMTLRIRSVLFGTSDETEMRIRLVRAEGRQLRLTPSAAPTMVITRVKDQGRGGGRGSSASGHGGRDMGTDKHVDKSLFTTTFQIKCRDLPKGGWGGGKHPCVCLFWKKEKGYKLLGRTETAAQTDHADFHVKLEVQHKRDSDPNLSFRVFALASSDNNPGKVPPTDSLCGYYNVSLRDCLKERNTAISQPLRTTAGKKAQGHIMLVCTSDLPEEELSATSYRLTVRCQNLPRLHELEANDTVVALFGWDESIADYVKIAHSDLIKGNDSPKYVKKFNVEAFSHQKLQFRIYKVDVERKLRRQCLGICTFTAGQLRIDTGQLRIDTGKLRIDKISDKKTKGKEDKNDKDKDKKEKENSKHGEKRLSLPLRSRDKKLSGLLRTKGTVLEIIAKDTHVDGVDDVPLMLTFSCTDLPKSDWFSKSDPVLILSQWDNKAHTWEQVGQTEMIKNEHNPQFKTPVLLPYNDNSKGQDKRLQIRVVDVDDASAVNANQQKDLLGQVELTLTQLLEETQNQDLTLSLVNIDGKEIKTHPRVLIRNHGDQKLGPASKIELTVKARNLPKADLMSKSDPVCAIYSQNPVSGEFIYSTQTECIKNNHDPDWEKKFLINKVGESAMVKFSVYDGDDKITTTQNLKESDRLGSCKVSINTLVAGNGRDLEFPLFAKAEKRAGSAYLIVSARDLSDSSFDTSDEENMVIEVNIRARDLIQMDMFSKSDPMVKVYTRHPTTKDYTEVGRTESIDNDHNPVFRTKIKFATFKTQAVMFKVYDCEEGGGQQDPDEEDLIGCTVCTVGDLVDLPTKEHRMKHDTNPKRNKKLKINDSRLLFKTKVISSSKAKQANAGKGDLQQFVLKIACRGLPKGDWFSKSDPICVIESETLSGAWNFIDQTERISNNHDPNFMKPLTVSKWSQENQQLRFSVYDVDDNKPIRLSNQKDLLGSMVVNTYDLFKKTGSTDNKQAEFKLLDSDGKQVNESTIIIKDITEMRKDMGEHTQVKIRLKCSNLPKKDLFSKSDPCVALHVKDVMTDAFKYIGQTEVIMNNHDPDFHHEFLVDRYEKKVQQMLFKVYNANDEKGKVTDKDLLGQAQVTINEARKNGNNIPLTNTKGKMLSPAAYLHLECETVGKEEEEYSDEEGDNDPMTIEVALRCSDLIKMDTFSKSDPLAKLFLSKGGEEKQVGQTEYLDNEHNPTFKTKISVECCPADTLRFAVYNSTNGKTEEKDLMGMYSAKIKSLIRGGQRAYPLNNPESEKLNKQLLNNNSALRCMIKITKGGNVNLVKKGNGDLTALQVKISCTGLPKSDWFSKSDPIVCVEILDPVSLIWEYKGQTEHIMNNHDPKFHTPLLIEHWTEDDEQVKFLVYDVDGPENIKQSKTKEILGLVTLGAKELASSQVTELKLLSPNGEPVNNTATIKIENMGDVTKYLGPAQPVDISVSCKNLRKNDTFSDSDPVCALYVQNPFTQEFAFKDQTERISDEHNPVFHHKFTVPQYENKGVQLEFRVYDVDDKEGTLLQKNLLGTARCVMTQLLNAPGGESEFKLLDAKGTHKAKQYIRLSAHKVGTGIGEDRTDDNEPWKPVKLKLEGSCKELIKLSRMGSQRPILVAEVLDKDTKLWKVVGKTEPSSDERDPVFKPPLELDTFYQQPLRFTVYNNDEKDPRNKIGESVMKAKDALIPRNFQLTHENKKRGDRLVRSDTRFFLRAAVIDEDGNEIHSGGHTHIHNGDLSKVTLLVSCRRLKKMDRFSDSDPMVFAEVQNKHTGAYHTVTQTEWKKDNHNPDFDTPLVLDHWSEEDEMVKLACYDVDDFKAPMKGRELLGEVVFSMKELLANPKDELEFKMLGLDGKQVLDSIMLVRKGAEGVARGVISKLELVVKCRNLAKQELLSKTDPVCAVYGLLPETGQFVLLAKTERIKNNHDPEFHTKLVVDHFSEYDQDLSFRLYQTDDDEHLSSKKMFASIDLKASELVESCDHDLALKLLNKAGKITKSTLILSTKHLKPKGKTTQLALTFSCSDLIQMGRVSKSDPLVVVYIKNEQDKFLYLAKTETVMNSHDPVFKKRITVKAFRESILKLSVYDSPGKSGQISEKHRIGSAILNVRDIMKNGGGLSKFHLENNINLTRNKALKKKASTIHVHSDILTGEAGELPHYVYEMGVVGRALPDRKTGVRIIRLHESCIHSGDKKHIKELTVPGDDTHPIFAERILFYAREEQELVIDVLDQKFKTDKQDDTILGTVLASMSEFVETPGDGFRLTNESAEVKAELEKSGSEMQPFTRVVSKGKTGSVDGLLKFTLTLSGSNLLRADHHSDSDPYVQIYIRDHLRKEFLYMARTETLMNTHDPNWKSVSFHAYPEEEIRLAVVDDDGFKDGVWKVEQLGELVLKASQLKDKQRLALTPPKGMTDSTAKALEEKKSELIIETVSQAAGEYFDLSEKDDGVVIEDASQTLDDKDPKYFDSGRIEFSFGCRSLIQLDTWSKSDPRVVLFLRESSGDYNFLDETETIDNEHDPKFSKKIQVATNRDATIMFAVFDDDDKSSDKTKAMGYITLKVGDILASKPDTVWPLRHKHNAKRDGKLRRAKSSITINPKVLTMKRMDASQLARIHRARKNVQLKLEFETQNLIDPTNPKKKELPYNVFVRVSGLDGNALLEELGATEEIEATKRKNNHFDEHLLFRTFEEQELKIELMSGDMNIGFAEMKADELINCETPTKFPIALSHENEDSLTNLKTAKTKVIAHIEIIEDKRPKKEGGRIILDQSQEYTRIEAKILAKANKLIQLDRFSKSDPRICLFIKPKDKNQFQFYSMTETIDNNHNPVFKIPFELDTAPDTLLKWCVYDDDDNEMNEKKKMGSVTMTFMELLRRAEWDRHALMHDLDKKREARLRKCKSTVSFLSEIISYEVPPEESKEDVTEFDENGEIKVQISCHHLVPMGPRIRNVIVKAFKMSAQTGNIKPHDKTEPIGGEINPKFDHRMTFSTRTEAMSLRFEVYDTETGDCTSNDLIGYASTYAGAITKKKHGLKLQLQCDDELRNNQLKENHAVIRLRPQSTKDRLLISRRPSSPGMTHTTWNSKATYTNIKLSLSFHCYSLIKRGLVFASCECRIVVFVKKENGKGFSLVDHTETVKGTIDPVFDKKILIDGVVQTDTIQLRVYHSKDPETDEARQLGSVTMTIQDLIERTGSPQPLEHLLNTARNTKLDKAGSTITAKVHILNLDKKVTRVETSESDSDSDSSSSSSSGSGSGSDSDEEGGGKDNNDGTGKGTLYGEPVQSEVALRCSRLVRTGGLLGKVNPRVEVWRNTNPAKNNSKWHFLDKTETIFNELDPTFTKRMQLTERPTTLLRFVVFNHDDSASQKDMLGEIEVEYARLIHSANNENGTVIAPVLFPGNADRNKKLKENQTTLAATTTLIL